MTENVFNEADGRLNRLFDKAVRSRSDEIALVYEDRRISFFELQLYVEWMAGYFQSISLQPRQRVALLLPNSPKFLISFFGLMRAGGVAVPFDISSDELELRLMLMLARANAVITTPEYKPLLDKVLAESRGNGLALPRLTIAVFEEDNIVTLNKTARERQTAVDNGKAAALNSRSEALAPRKANGRALMAATEAVPDQPAVVQFKEAQQFCVRTHEDLGREAEAMIAQIQLTVDDRLVCLAPLCQINCLSHCLIAAVVAGATMVLPEPGNRDGIRQLLVDERVTVLAGPAALLKCLAENHPDTFSLRWYFCTDALSPEIGERLSQRMGFKVGQLIETTGAGISCQL